MGDYFSPTGTMRQNLWNNNRNESKQFEIGNPILARYFWELIESGVNSIQFMLEGMREKELPNGQGMVVECVKAGIIYTYKDAMVRLQFLIISIFSLTRSILTLYSASTMAH